MTPEKFLDVIHQTPLVSIDLLLEDGEGNVLLGRRVNKPAQGSWFVPGGRIRKNETLRDAMRRISRVELGIEIAIEDTDMCGAYDHIYNDNALDAPNINTHYVALAYRYQLASHFDIQGDEQHSDMRWWPKDQLLSDENVHPNTKAYYL